MSYNQEHLNSLRLERQKLQKTLQCLENPTMNEIELVRRRELVQMWRRKIELLCKQEIELSRKLHRVQEPEQGLGQNLETVLIQDITLEKKLDNLPSVFNVKKQNELFLFLAHKLFPEDCIAELVALYQQLKAQNQFRCRWVIAIIIFCNVLELFCNLYIYIKFENIWLPKRKIDE